MCIINLQVNLVTFLAMMQVVAWLCLIGVVRTMPHGRPNTGDSSNKIEHLEEQLERVSRQLMMQQYYVEEAARSGGNSGIKRMRSSVQGMRTYHSASYADTETTAAIHDHPNYERTLGLGEIVAVLNGVEFRTRHNDYPLKMRQENNGPLVDIPFPDVPREVTQYTSVDDQIKEMREWFKAWAKQDRSKKDYRPFFNPVLCILEGAWTHSDPSTIDEPFDSERNHLDANSWLELAKKVMSLFKLRFELFNDGYADPLIQPTFVIMRFIFHTNLFATRYKYCMEITNLACNYQVGVPRDKQIHLFLQYWMVLSIFN